jgi:hypothetical protein
LTVVHVDTPLPPYGRRSHYLLRSTIPVVWSLVILHMPPRHSLTQTVFSLCLLARTMHHFRSFPRSSISICAGAHHPRALARHADAAPEESTLCALSRVAQSLPALPPTSPFLACGRVVGHIARQAVSAHVRRPDTLSSLPAPRAGRVRARRRD